MLVKPLKWRKKLIIKLGAISCIFICLLGKAEQMESQNNIQEGNKYEKSSFSIGRGVITIPEKFKARGGSMSYSDVDIVEDDNISKKTFDAWIDNRWEEIKADDAIFSKNHLPSINRLSPSAVWFKFRYLKADDDIVYKGEGAVWHDNKAIFLSPGGMFTADKKIPKIIDKISPKKGVEGGDYFCGRNFCVKVPPIDNESVNISFDSLDIKGLKLSVETKTLFREKKSAYPNNIFSDKKEIDGILGIQTFLGGTECSPSGACYTSISSAWYYPGVVKDFSLPEIRIMLTYEYETNYRPSKDGGFDDRTVKETGFTREKFMSIWESTLTSFKRSR